ncbi:HEAT repeat domain-containing protein [bacterium]|nr:HEAT repeat domain-containing protein [bacterium]
MDSSLEGELNLDLSPSSPENEEKGLSFDLEPSSPAESPADISLDLNVDSTELRLDVPSDDGTFDLGVGPTEIKPQVATHSPKKSPPTPPPLPPKVDMKPAPVISETPKKQPTPVSPAPSESEFDLGPLTTESQSIDLNIGEGDVGAIQVDEAAQGNQDLPQSEFSFPSMDSPDNEPAGQALDLSPQTSLETNVDNFDMSAVGSSDSMVVEFGDLDAGIPGSASQAQTQDFEVAVEQPVEPQKAIPKSSGKPAVSPSLSSKPEPVQDVVFDFSESTFPVPPAKVVKPLAPTKPLEQARKTHLPEAVEVDEDLTNLILGIEGKPKPVVTPHPPQSSREKPEISGKQQPKVELKEMEPTVGEETTEQVAEPDEGTSIDFAPPTDELQEKSVDAVPNIELEPQPEPILEIPEESVPPTPEELLAQIRTNLTESNDPDERYSLVLSLRDLRLPEVCSDFLKLLFDDLKDIREVAAEFLGEMSCKEAVRPLIQCLATGDPSLKFIAARALGSIRDETSVVPLMKLLEEDNDDLRYVALEALGKVGASGALKALSAFLKSRNHDLRYIACEAIGNVREPQSVSFLLPMLKDPDFEVRVKAIEALGKIGSTEACDQLLVVLGEDNERIRLATIHALGQIKNPNAIDSLTDIYQVSNPEIKEKIVWSLGEIGNERAVEPLLSLSQGFNSKLTLLGLEAFSKIKSAKAVRFVLSVLDRDDISLKHKAIEALGEIADKLTAGNLIPFLESPEPGLKISAAKALGKIGNAIAIDPLVSRLMDSERDVRIHAIEALGLIKGGKAIPPLINSLREQDEQIIQKTEWALCELQEMSVDPITKAIFTEPTEVVPSLVRVLGRIGSIRGIFPLLKMLEVADPKLKPVIADSLLAIDKHMTEENPISVILKEGYAWAQFSIAQALSQLNDERAREKVSGNSG